MSLGGRFFLLEATPGTGEGCFVKKAATASCSSWLTTWVCCKVPLSSLFTWLPVDPDETESLPIWQTSSSVLRSCLSMAAVLMDRWGGAWGCGCSALGLVRPEKRLVLFGTCWPQEDKAWMICFLSCSWRVSQTSCPWGLRPCQQLGGRREPHSGRLALLLILMTAVLMSQVSLFP